VEISCRVYKPRRGRRALLFRLVEQHLEEFLRVYEVRFARVHGLLRPVVERRIATVIPRDPYGLSNSGR
jgi:hypothetical protein